MNRLFVLMMLFAALLAAPGRAADPEADELLKQGIAEQLNGEFFLSRATLTQAVDRSPQVAQSHIALAITLLELGDGFGARMHVERAIALNYPRNAAQHLLAFATLLAGEPNDALALAEQRNLEPAQQGYGARVRALALLALDRKDEAGAEFDRAIMLDPGIRGLWSDVADFRIFAGDLAGAMEAALKEIANAPRSQRAMMQMGGFVRDRFGLVAAIPWYDRAVRLDPDNLEALGELAATLGDAGRTRDMLAATRRMLEIEPENPRAFYLQAVLAARANKAELARALLYRLGKKMADVPSVILLNAILELQAGSAESAISRLQKLVDLQPDNLKARRLLGAALWRAGDANGAIDALRQIAERDDADSYTLSIMARAFERNGERSEAARYLDRISQGESSEATPFNVSHDLVRLAHATSAPSDQADQAVPWIAKAVQDGRLDEAIAQARHLAEENPGAPAAQILAGDALTAAGRYGDAVIAYRRAAELRFDEPVMLRMVDGLIAAGNPGEALRVLDYFLSQNPRNISGLLLAADHFMATEQWARAAAILSGVRKRLGDRDAAVLTNLGWALFNTGDAASALTYSAQAHALLPDNAEIASAYGWILYKSGENRKAGVAMMRKAVQISQQEMELRFRLGQALLFTGDQAGAKTQLTAVANSPVYPLRAKAQELLEKL